MASLSDTTKEGVVYHLGYTSKPNSTAFLADLNRDDFNDRDVVGIDAVVSQLDTIDSELVSSQAIWMTEQAGTKKLNYGKKIGLLKREGSRLLMQLAHLVNVGIAIDKFAGDRAMKGFYY